MYKFTYTWQIVWDEVTVMTKIMGRHHEQMIRRCDVEWYSKATMRRNTGPGTQRPPSGNNKGSVLTSHHVEITSRRYPETTLWR